LPFDSLNDHIRSGLHPREVRMNRVFEPRHFSIVPDGTEVSAFLNATDTNQPDLPLGALAEMSIAAGRVRPRLHSAVHVLPVVTQVTYVVAGELTVRMKERDASASYDLRVKAGQAVVTRPGTLLQLRNDGNAVAQALYIVSPSFVFELNAGAVVYDDAVVVAKSWKALEDRGDAVPALTIPASETNARRDAAKRRLAAVKASSPSA
jgi:mannose-6-phosphate isomerase-like protein (cupin superfamily)